MSDQPKLKGSTHEPWEHIAREFGDHDLENVGYAYNAWREMEPVTDAYYVGDWLRAEPVCRELDRLRRERGETERALREWCGDIDSRIGPHAESVDRMRLIQFREGMKTRGLWRDPDAKEQGDG